MNNRKLATQTLGHNTFVKNQYSNSLIVNILIR